MLTVLAGPEEGASLRPLPWRRMTWVIWRQHRAGLIGVVALLGALAVWLGIAGLQLHHAYAVATACRPATALACSDLVSRFNGMDNGLLNGFALQPVPALIGAFIGAPLLARELETGTFRYAWTQGFGRVRWTLAKLVALAIVLAAAAGAFSLVISWYFRPYFQTGNRTLALSEVSPLNPGLFDLRGVGFGGLDTGRLRYRRPGRHAHSQGPPRRRRHPGLLHGPRLCDRAVLPPALPHTAGFRQPRPVGVARLGMGHQRAVGYQGRPAGQPVHVGQGPSGGTTICGWERGGPEGPELGTVPRAARLHAVDRLPAGHPVLVVPVHGSGMAPCPLRPPGRRHDLARPSTAVLNIGPNHTYANPETLWATPRHRPFASRGGLGAPRC